jgi:phage shock protein A
MLRAVMNKLLGRDVPREDPEGAPVAVPMDSTEALLEAIDARWHSSEIQLQHARRRIADIVVTRRALGDEVPDSVNQSLDAAQAELQAAVDESALSVERTRREAALLKTRVHVAETRDEIYKLRDAMDQADSRMDEALERVANLVMSHEAMIQAREELDT